MGRKKGSKNKPKDGSMIAPEKVSPNSKDIKKVVKNKLTDEEKKAAQNALDKMDEYDESSDQKIRKIKRDAEHLIGEHQSRERKAKESVEAFEKQKAALMKAKQE